MFVRCVLFFSCLFFGSIAAVAAAVFVAVAVYLFFFCFSCTVFQSLPPIRFPLPRSFKHKSGGAAGSCLFYVCFFIILLTDEPLALQHANRADVCGRFLFFIFSLVLFAYLFRSITVGFLFHSISKHIIRATATATCTRTKLFMLHGHRIGIAHCERPRGQEASAHSVPATATSTHTCSHACHTHRSIRH